METQLARLIYDALKEQGIYCKLAPDLSCVVIDDDSCDFIAIADYIVEHLEPSIKE